MSEIARFLVVPSHLIVLLFIAGLITLLFRRTRGSSVFLLGTGAALYIVFGMGPVSYWLLGRLEQRYPAIHSLDHLENIGTIVILTGHVEPDPYFPISSAVSSSAAFRLMEAARIWKMFPDKQILISGHETAAGIMKKVLVSLGLPESQIAIEGRSGNTYESAVNIQKIMGSRSFILVTSAGHMPRTMGAFRKLGMNPVPAPTDYMTGQHYMDAKFLPTPSHLRYSDLAIHEYLGILWYRLKGRL
ncbi:MAG: hypothetical protein FJ110_13530 [Deltaproteobacteria bacterium]|nr:hypothetical protein [Deltaproteobacteria bacterium]